MATMIWRLILGDDLNAIFRIPQGAEIATLRGSQGFWLVVFYGSGIIGIFGLYAILKIHAIKLRKQLELDEIEIYLTRHSIVMDGIWIGVASLSIFLSFFSAPFAGLVYCLMGPLCGVFGAVGGNKAERMYKEKYGVAPGIYVEEESDAEVLVDKESSDVEITSNEIPDS